MTETQCIELMETLMQGFTAQQYEEMLKKIREEED